jgi:hypothetical protein
MMCLLDVLKNDFGGVDDAIYQSVRPFEFNFCTQGIEKKRFLQSRLSDV